MTRRRRDRPGVLKILGLSVLSLALLAIATFIVANEFLGTRERATVESCDDRGPDSTDIPIHRCMGLTSDTPPQSVTIIGATQSDYRHVVDIHRTGELATKDASFDMWWAPVLFVGLGGWAGHGAVSALRRRRAAQQVSPEQAAAQVWDAWSPGPSNEPPARPSDQGAGWP